MIDSFCWPLRWCPQFARPRWGCEHQWGLLHRGEDTSRGPQAPVLWWGGLSGQRPQSSAPSCMLRGAEDLCADLHSQAAQQLQQVDGEIVKNITQQVFFTEVFFPQCFWWILFLGASQVQAAKVVGSVFSPRSPSYCSRVSRSWRSGCCHRDLSSLRDFAYHQGSFIVVVLLLLLLFFLEPY